MAEWKSFNPDEDEEEEEVEEGTETEGDHQFSGRDSLIFLVDASKAMFESLDEDGNTSFDITIQCIRNVYTSKIISSERDLLGLVFFGTDKHKNSVDFKHVYVLHELDTPGAKRVLELDKYKGKKGRAHFSEAIGHNEGYSLSDALWICANLFSDVKLRMSHKRIMLFTNNDNPHVGDNTKIKLAITKASDLRETGIFLDLMHLKKDGGFDIALFYRDIINISEDENLGVQFQESAKLEDLMKKVRAKENRKRALCRLNLKLSKDLALTVGVFNLVQKAVKPAPVKLYRETNEPVKTKTRTFNRETGSLMLPSDTKRAQVYGNRQIVLEREETEQVKHFDDPSLILIGFKPLALLKKHHFIKPAQFLYPDESLVTGFHLIFLPYVDDIRRLQVSDKVTAGREQVDKMKEILQKLRFKYRSDDFENPVLQQHFRNLEALALDLMEPESVEDLTLPKVNMMDNRLGPLVDEFKELVYPPDYNPEGKAVKRKPAGEGKGHAEKKVKTEVSVSEEDLRNYVKKGTLGKLTVPVLKEACRGYGLKGSKKQELVDVLSDYFSKH
ncbi:X-ray repair cross-complementing protein 6 isoform X3 [Rhinatrema bivittatum]|uniref:X-ray repair cross-complementing protein 6 isoform X3 n=1 Tax=Rhinatrema bivittatum TaxID=194408 RepID=UPI00112C4330|nr:X-ray repair cross-complementing protein 6 isoform X3 [Rhinatrema bivittatum]